jgi:NADPH-dependent 2,4-dienoyl-CoA reductase/sulfur reductase-like enzyme
VTAVAEPDVNQHVREGASEAELVQVQVPSHQDLSAPGDCICAIITKVMLDNPCEHCVLDQAHKEDTVQRRLADALPPFDLHVGVVDAVVVGCGPAGLSLAAELASRGVRAVLIGELRKFQK